MSFYDWMVKKYSSKNTMRGDFAYDMEHVSSFTASNDKDYEKEIL